MREALDHVVKRTRRKTTFRHVERKFWFRTRNGEPALQNEPPVFDELVDALMEQKFVTMVYQRFEGNRNTLRVMPLSIAVHDHHLYLIGRSAGRPAYPYRLARIERVEVEDETFSYPSASEYDPRQVFHDSFGIFVSNDVEDVEVRLDLRWEHYVKHHRWHESQSIAVQDGAVTVRMRVRTCPELRTWILGFGHEAEVIKPASLRADVANRARLLAEKYGASP